MIDGIKLATPKDSNELLQIYAPYIQDTAITFEVDVPTSREYKQRVADICGYYPYLAWIENGSIVGYAYATKYHERSGYRYDVSTSIYLAPYAQGKGIGRRLYSCLLDVLKAQGMQNAYAAITLPNEKSVGLHAALGFCTVGIFRRTGRKFEEWLDVSWMEKPLGDFPEPPPPLVDVADLPDELWQRLGVHKR